MKFSLKTEKMLFYSIMTILTMSIFFSTPFLRYPYDIFHHLIVIDNFYTQLENPVHQLIGIWSDTLYFMIPTEDMEPITLAQPKYLWHYSWALLFHWFNIDSTQMFLRAKIIHIIQTFISLIAIYYFSHVALRNLFRNIPVITLKLLSLCSVLIWLSIYATVSGPYHQVWLMWYSVNYQITLPLFWYILGLTLVLFLEQTSWKIKFFFILQILLISRFMLQVHSMEFLYYLMHIIILSLIFLDKILNILKKYFLLIIPIGTGTIYLAAHFRPSQSPILKYLSLEKLPELYDKIMREGSFLLHGLNRASSSINELMYLSVFLSILYFIYLFYIKFYRKENLNINIRMLIFISLTSLFILIPLYQFSSGLFAMITYTNVVNRLYYSASIFLLLPIVIYGVLSRYKINAIYIFIVIFMLVVSVSIFSKKNNILNHNYYKNLLSIQNSFQEEKVGFNLSQQEIISIGEKIKFYEKNNSTFKKIKNYARADIAFVIKYIYHKEVYWEGRHANPNYIKIYNATKSNNNFNPILFKIPKDFPPYHPYM